MKINGYCFFAALFSYLVLTSCGVSKALIGKITYYYPGTATLADGKKTVGFFEMPSPNADELHLFSESNGNGTKEVIPAKDVLLLEMYNPSLPQKVVVFEYLSIKEKNEKSTKRWVHRLTKSDNLKVYIGAENYKIDTEGDVVLMGTTQVINHGANRGSAVIQPSYPVYMMKNDDKVLGFVGLRSGIEFEGSSLRAGVVRFLADDPKLCEYILDQKLDFNHINDIAMLYNPNRGDMPLMVDGAAFKVVKHFFTHALDKELMFSFEAGKQLNKYHGPEFGLGIRSSLFKFFSYGADLGVAMMKTVDDIKRIENHPMNTSTTGESWVDAPVIDEDLVNGAHFRFNTYVGAQLPMNPGNIYLIPSAHISFGGLFGTNYGALNWGPMINLDLGFPMKHGSIMLIGAGYRMSNPIVSDENRQQATYPGFDTYASFNTIYMRVGFKF